MYRRHFMFMVSGRGGHWFAGVGCHRWPQEDVAAATANWARIFGDNNPILCCLSTQRDAVLWGTLSPTLR